MMTFRVSHVEAFRRYQQDEEMSLEDLVATIRGERPPTVAMEAGTAFHRALELSPTGMEAESLGANNYTFNIVGDIELELPPVREVRASKTWVVDGLPIAISGQVDAIDGKSVHDHKTTGRFDPDRYVAGCQWKMYLDIFGADHFRWNVFEIAVTDDPLTWDVFAFHRLEQYRYPGMEKDCAGLVASLARFARQHLPERFLALEPA